MCYLAAVPKSDLTSDLTEFVGPVRLSPQDLAALKAKARENERTVSAEIRLAVRKHLREVAA